MATFIVKYKKIKENGHPVLMENNDKTPILFSDKDSAINFLKSRGVSEDMIADGIVIESVTEVPGFAKVKWDLIHPLVSDNKISSRFIKALKE